VTEAWDFREVRLLFVEGNTHLQNELGDIYNEAFSLIENKKKQSERKKS
jgi:hypothetical protein